MSSSAFNALAIAASSAFQQSFDHHFPFCFFKLFVAVHVFRNIILFSQKFWSRMRAKRWK